MNKKKLKFYMIIKKKLNKILNCESNIPNHHPHHPCASHLFNYELYVVFGKT